MESENQVFRNLSESDIIEKVLRIDLIFEEVLKHLIFDKNLLINREMVQTVRLVNKHWLNTTSTLLTRTSIPTFVIKTEVTPCLKNEIHLNLIYQSLTSTDRLDNSFLPFKLILTSNYFKEYNHPSLLNCLSQLKDELIDLQISIPETVLEKLSLVFPNFTLPQLKKLSFEFTVKTEKGLLLLQQILNASDNLQEFVLIHKWIPTFPENFQSLKLPKSVLSIEVEDRLKTEYVNILLNNHLPHLKRLTLNMPATILESEMMFQILEYYQFSLRSLHLTSRRLRDNAIVLKFPKLEKLQNLQLTGKDYEFERPSSSDLQKLFPSVKTVKLDGGPVRFEILTQVYVTFPNVSRLTIGVNTHNMSGLLYLFTNMTQLKSLRLDVREGINQRNYEYILTCYSTFIGLPAWLISAHQPESAFFQSFIRKRGRKPCLINLSELTSFTLWVQDNSLFRRTRYFVEKTYGCNFTDLMFTQSLFHMPKLRHITISDNLQLPTKQIEETWKAQGRILEYISQEE